MSKIFQKSNFKNLNFIFLWLWMIKFFVFFFKLLATISLLAAIRLSVRRVRKLRKRIVNCLDSSICRLGLGHWFKNCHNWRRQNRTDQNCWHRKASRRLSDASQRRRIQATSQRSLLGARAGAVIERKCRVESFGRSIKSDIAWIETEYFCIWIHLISFSVNFLVSGNVKQKVKILEERITLSHSNRWCPWD